MDNFWTLEYYLNQSKSIRGFTKTFISIHSTFCMLAASQQEYVNHGRLEPDNFYPVAQPFFNRLRNQNLLN
jgi:hypothetical protein